MEATAPPTAGRVPSEPPSMVAARALYAADLQAQAEDRAMREKAARAASRAEAAASTGLPLGTHADYDRQRMAARAAAADAALIAATSPRHSSNAPKGFSSPEDQRKREDQSELPGGGGLRLGSRSDYDRRRMAAAQARQHAVLPATGGQRAPASQKHSDGHPPSSPTELPGGGGLQIGGLRDYDRQRMEAAQRKADASVGLTRPSHSGKAGELSSPPAAVGAQTSSQDSPEQSSGSVVLQPTADIADHHSQAAAKAEAAARAFQVRQAEQQRQQAAEDAERAAAMQSKAAYAAALRSQMESAARRKGAKRTEAGNRHAPPPPRQVPQISAAAALEHGRPLAFDAHTVDARQIDEEVEELPGGGGLVFGAASDYDRQRMQARQLAAAELQARAAAGIAKHDTSTGDTPGGGGWLDPHRFPVPVRAQGSHVPVLSPGEDFHQQQAPAGSQTEGGKFPGEASKATPPYLQHRGRPDPTRPPQQTGWVPDSHRGGPTGASLRNMFGGTPDEAATRGQLDAQQRYRLELEAQMAEGAARKAAQAATAQEEEDRIMAAIKADIRAGKGALPFSTPSEHHHGVPGPGHTREAAAMASAGAGVLASGITQAPQAMHGNVAEGVGPLRAGLTPAQLLAKKQAADEQARALEAQIAERAAAKAAALAAERAADAAEEARIKREQEELGARHEAELEAERKKAALKKAEAEAEENARRAAEKKRQRALEAARKAAEDAAADAKAERERKEMAEQYAAEKQRDNRALPAPASSKMRQEGVPSTGASPQPVGAAGRSHLFGRQSPAQPSADVDTAPPAAQQGGSIPQALPAPGQTVQHQERFQAPAAQGTAAPGFHGPTGGVAVAHTAQAHSDPPRSKDQATQPYDQAATQSFGAGLQHSHVVRGYSGPTHMTGFAQSVAPQLRQSTSGLDFAQVGTLADTIPAPNAPQAWADVTLDSSSHLLPFSSVSPRTSATHGLPWQELPQARQAALRSQPRPARPVSTGAAAGIADARRPTVHELEAERVSSAPGHGPGFQLDGSSSEEDSRPARRTKASVPAGHADVVGHLADALGVSGPSGFPACRVAPSTPMTSRSIQGQSKWLADSHWGGLPFPHSTVVEEEEGGLVVETDIGVVGAHGQLSKTSSPEQEDSARSGSEEHLASASRAGSRQTSRSVRTEASDWLGALAGTDPSRQAAASRQSGASSAKGGARAASRAFLPGDLHLDDDISDGVSVGGLSFMSLHSTTDYEGIAARNAARLANLRKLELAYNSGVEAVEGEAATEDQRAGQLIDDVLTQYLQEAAGVTKPAQPVPSLPLPGRVFPSIDTEEPLGSASSRGVLGVAGSMVLRKQGHALPPAASAAGPTPADLHPSAKFAQSRDLLAAQRESGSVPGLASATTRASSASEAYPEAARSRAKRERHKHSKQKKHKSKSTRRQARQKAESPPSDSSALSFSSSGGEEDEHGPRASMHLAPRRHKAATGAVTAPMPTMLVSNGMPTYMSMGMPVHMGMPVSFGGQPVTQPGMFLEARKSGRRRRKQGKVKAPRRKRRERGQRQVSSSSSSATSSEFSLSESEASARQRRGGQGTAPLAEAQPSGQAQLRTGKPYDLGTPHIAASDSPEPTYRSLAGNSKWLGKGS